MYLYTGGDTDVEKKMYGRLLLMKLMTKETDIELPSPLANKFYFHELEVCCYSLYVYYTVSCMGTSLC